MDKSKEILYKLINFKTQRVDFYTHKNSVWLILTEEKKWVIELTKEGTLWYNYYFFENCFRPLGLEVTKNQHYITEWVENFTRNGVKHTDACQIGISTSVEDTIQNGVKDTKAQLWDGGLAMEEVIQNGIKETTPGGYLGSVEIKSKTVHQFETAKQLYYLEDVINDGIKEVKELPDKSGMLLGYGEYYARREDKTYPHTDIVNDAIRDGIKETKYCELHSLMRADHIIRDGIKETWGYEKQPQVRVNEVLDMGITQTHWRRVDNHPTYVDNIINKNN